MSESFDCPVAVEELPVQCCLQGRISGGQFHHETCKTPHCTELVVTERFRENGSVREVKKPCGRILPCVQHTVRSNG